MIGYTQALTNQISYGVCVNNGECPSITGQEGLNYDLNNLQAKLLQNITIMGKIRNFIIEYAAYISMCVLFLELTKFGLTMFTISLTLARQGIQGLKILLFSLCCADYIKYIKIKESCNKAKRNETELQDLESE